MSDAQTKPSLQRTLANKREAFDMDRFDVLATDEEMGVESPDHVVMTLQDWEVKKAVHAIKERRVVEGECHNCGCNRLIEEYIDMGEVFHSFTCPVCNASRTSGGVEEDDGVELEVNQE